MSIFGKLGQQRPMMNAGINPMQMLQQLMSNPAQIVSQAGYSVPADIAKNPQDIINHLTSSGQISQQRLQAAQQMMSRMGFTAGQNK